MSMLRYFYYLIITIMVNYVWDSQDKILDEIDKLEDWLFFLEDVQSKENNSIAIDNIEEQKNYIIKKINNLFDK